MLDFTNFKNQIPSTFKYASLDEILNSKKINNTNIDNKIPSFFQQNDYLTKIYNQNIQPIIIPKVYYLCKEENGEFVNIENIRDEPILFIPRTFIKGKGNFFLFSETPILKNESRELKQVLLFFDENSPDVLKENSGFFNSSKKFEKIYNFNKFEQKSTKYLFIKSLDGVLDLHF